jgi:UDP-N-acetylmuramyl pentapeptide phosphotransferase/UDP-N-acetylglucosamine-1-phosphate transferase
MIPKRNFLVIILKYLYHQLQRIIINSSGFYDDAYHLFEKHKRFLNAFQITSIIFYEIFQYYAFHNIYTLEAMFGWKL